MAHSKMRRRMWVFAQFVAVLAVPNSVTKAERTTLVTPPGFEDVEGGSVFNDAGTTMPNGFRVQELHRASEFASLGPGPLRITQMAFRPDVLVTQPRSVQWNLTALNLSTTTVDPGSLSTVFDNNYGSDEFTTVLSGNVQLMTDGAARPGGLPHDFDYVFDFQTPYVYDPQEGNLLVEFISKTDLAGARTWQDATAPSPVGDTFLGGLDADAEIAALSLPLITITQFTIEASPPNALRAGDANQDLSFDQFDLIRVQQAAKYLTRQQATWGEGDWDGAPGGSVGNPPAGDGVFDQLDVVAALGAGTYLTGPYAASQATGQTGDGQARAVAKSVAGDAAVDALARVEEASIDTRFAVGIFTAHLAENLGGDSANRKAFAAPMGSSLGSASIRNVPQHRLSPDSVLDGRSVAGSLAGGAELAEMDLVHVPEPASLALLAPGIVIVLVSWKSRRIFA